MENNASRELTISEDLHHILNVLNPKDAENILVLKEELLTFDDARKQLTKGQ